MSCRKIHILYREFNSYLSGRYINTLGKNDYRLRLGSYGNQLPYLSPDTRKMTSPG